MYLLFMFLCLLMYTYFGIMSVALAASLTAANVISTTGYAIWNLMAGLILPLPVLPALSQAPVTNSRPPYGPWGPLELWVTPARFCTAEFVSVVGPSRVPSLPFVTGQEFANAVTCLRMRVAIASCR